MQTFSDDGCGDDSPGPSFPHSLKQRGAQRSTTAPTSCRTVCRTLTQSRVARCRGHDKSRSRERCPSIYKGHLHVGEQNERL